MSPRRGLEGAGDLFAEAPEASVVVVETTEPLDQTARDAATDVTRSCIVEAPAGSGKTGLLILRYLKLLSLPDVQQPEQVLAITFTIKAAGEIRERVLKQLERTESAELHGFEAELAHYAATARGRSQQLGWGLLEHPERMNLRTIDSVCAEIARSMPLLAGAGGLRPIEDASLLHELAAERTLMQLGSSDSQLDGALRTVLLHRDGDLDRCRGLLAEMLGLRDQWGRLIPLTRDRLEEAFLDEEVLPRLERSLLSAIRSELESVQNAFPNNLLERLSIAAVDMSGNDGYDGALSPLACWRGREGAPTSKLDDLERWLALSHLLLTARSEWRKGYSRNHLGFEITKPQKEELREIVDLLEGDEVLRTRLQQLRKLPPASYPPEQWRVTKALFVVLHHALVELQLVFTERGECDFTELGLQARAALRHEGAALEAVAGGRLQHLLIDEMQDTSTSQYDLIELLTQGWDGHSQTVFLVGDPKQSIYLFRQARVERFLQTMRHERLGVLPVAAKYLQANFRSQAGLVEAFNKTFSRVFYADTNQTDAVRYLPAEASRKAFVEDAPNSVWHAQVFSRDDDTSAAGKIEAAAIREAIDAWRCRPLPDGRRQWKIAVLVRGRRHLADIVEALKQDKGSGPIPFRAMDIEPLSERPEILDLYALTRALLHPADRVAWLSVLRSPWCGLELADLHRLCGEDDSQWNMRTTAELIEQRGTLLPQEAQQRVHRVLAILLEARRQASAYRLSELVERSWRSLGGDLFLSPEERSNANQYLALLEAVDQGDKGLNLVLLQRRLAKLYAAPSTEESAVDLMTIHGAKGLEWDVVLVPGLEKSSPTERHRLLNWEELDTDDPTEAGVLLAPIPGKGEESSQLNQWLHSLNERRLTAETKRLFYVACTRAREELHLFATVKLKQDGTPSIKSGTMLHAAWAAAEPYFADAIAAATDMTSTDEVIAFPAKKDPEILPALAAQSSTNAELYRLPLSAIQLTQSVQTAKQQLRPHSSLATFERPSGSFEARAFGSTVHELLELLAHRLAEGDTADRLALEVQQWRPRILALLRSRGLTQAALARYAPAVSQALEQTLRDPSGLWILQQQTDAASEMAWTTWEERRSSVRMDRIFRAGAEPGHAGQEFRWILDFKTANYVGDDISGFLQQERTKYIAQLEQYAQILREAEPETPLRAGLYYPLLSKLIWWEI